MPGTMRAYRTAMKPRRPIQSRIRRTRGPASCSTASKPTRREIRNAQHAPSVAAVSETGKPSAVPNSSPLAPASTGPGNSAHVSAADTTMKTSGAATPKPSTQSRTRAAENPLTAPAISTAASRDAASAPSRSQASRGSASAAGGGVEGGLFTPELRDRLVAVDPLAGDPVEVRVRAQLREHRERQHLHAPAEQVVGGERLVVHLAEVLRAGVRHVDHDLRGDLGHELDVLVEHVPPRGVAELREQLVRAEVLRVLEEAGLGPDPLELLAVALVTGPLARELDLEQLARHHLEEAEVEEGDPAVVHQQEVAGMGVARELVVAVHAAEVEAEHGLADAVARRLVELLDGVEPEAGDELGDDHLLARERGHDLRHHDERVAAEDPRHRALVLRLELVVELVADAAARLLRGRLHVEPGRDPLQQPQDHPQVLHVGPLRLGDPRVLNLDRDLAAVVQARAVDLADRGGGDRRLVELGERVAELLAELGLHDLAHVGEAHLRRGVAQLAQLALELLPVLLGDEADVEERHHLAELHRGALHRPERRDDLLGGLDVAALERLLLALLVAGQVRRRRAELAGGLTRREAGHPGRAGEA